MNIYILHSALHFFVWYPLTKRFSCVSKKDMPELEIDMEEITELVRNGNKDEAHSLLKGIKDFITELPGEAEQGVAIIEGPFMLQESATKYAAWKLKFGEGKTSLLNSLLTELGINVSED